MQSRLLYKHHAEKNRQDESKGFRLFILTQFIHYGALLLMLLGGLLFIVMGARAIFS